MNPTHPEPRPANAPRLAQALANLEAWLTTLRQPGGYGGPVAHWWQNRLRFTAPGLDWRYEGILIGYHKLWVKTRNPVYRDRLGRAAQDLIRGQLADGSYRASRFELNPGTLGTPHEAAATLGLTEALGGLDDREAALRTAKRNLDHLLARLYDPQRKTYTDRVPNKLATLAQALLSYAGASGEAQYLDYARAALDQTLEYQLPDGSIHQYAPTEGRGDARFFPYYNARCVPPLAEAARVLGEPRYLEAAHKVLGFIERTRQADGGWPMIVYGNGSRVEAPRWIAANADVLLAYQALGEDLPKAVLERLLAGQLESGGFRTMESENPEYPHPRHTLPVAGWNDKVFRLLTGLLAPGEALPAPRTGLAEVRVWLDRKPAWFCENDEAIVVQDQHEVFYEWRKTEPWARVVCPELDVR